MPRGFLRGQAARARGRGRGDVPGTGRRQGAQGGWQREQAPGFVAEAVSHRAQAGGEARDTSGNVLAHGVERDRDAESWRERPRRLDPPQASTEPGRR